MEKNNHGLKWRVLQKPPLAHCLETGGTNCLQLSIHRNHFSFIFQQLYKNLLPCLVCSADRLMVIEVSHFLHCRAQNYCNYY